MQSKVFEAQVNSTRKILFLSTTFFLGFFFFPLSLVRGGVGYYSHSGNHSEIARVLFQNAPIVCCESFPIFCKILGPKIIFLISISAFENTVTRKFSLRHGSRMIRHTSLKYRRYTSQNHLHFNCPAHSGSDSRQKYCSLKSKFVTQRCLGSILSVNIRWMFSCFQ